MVKTCRTGQVGRHPPTNLTHSTNLTYPTHLTYLTHPTSKVRSELEADGELGVERGFPPSLKLRRTAEALAEAGQPRRPATLKGSPYVSSIFLMATHVRRGFQPRRPETLKGSPYISTIFLIASHVIRASELEADREFGLS